jgi:hypothetical protein
VLHVCFSIVSVLLIFPHLDGCHAAFYLTLIFTVEQQRPCRCHMPPRRLRPAQPQPHRAAPRPQALRLRWARRVAGRGAAAAAQRRCAQGRELEAGARFFAGTRCLRAQSECAARATRVAPPNPAAASLTTFAGAPRHVARVYFVYARRRICSCRPRPLQRACARFAAPRAAGGHAVAALARTCGTAGQAIPWQRAAAAAVLRQPPVRPADPPRRCCRPQRSLQRRAQIRRLHRQALLQRRRAQALAQEAMKTSTLFEFY